MKNSKMVATRFFIIVILLMTFLVLSGPTVLARQGPPQVPPGKDIVDENKNKGWDKVVEKFAENGITLPEHINNKLKEYIDSKNEVILPLVATGYEHSIIVTIEGRIFTWGRNHRGQLGDGTYQNTTIPIEITYQFQLGENERFIQLVATYGHSMALTNHGRVYVWGDNSYGQLGTGTTVAQNAPLDITDSFNLIDDQVIHITAENYHSMALTQKGNVITWGRHLSTGGWGSNYFPVDITYTFSLDEGEKIVDVFGSWYNSIALSNQGKVFAWGQEYYGQVGVGYTSLKPVDITHKFNLNQDDMIISVTLGHRHSGVFTKQGQIYTWGQNFYGQIGNGGFGNYSVYTPINITEGFGLEDDHLINYISGKYHNFALTKKTNLLVWGYNAYGQLGIGSYINNPLPIDITPFLELNENEHVVSFSGYFHTIVATSNNRYFACGFNNYGQVGNGTTGNKNTFIDITPYIYQ
jgi:alpha-tubulin suppressor-like RCC1 family protein